MKFITTIVILLLLLHQFSIWATGFGQYDRLFNVEKHVKILEIITPDVPATADYPSTYTLHPDSSYGQYQADVDTLLRARLSDFASFQYITYSTSCGHQLCATIHYSYDGIKYSETIGISFSPPSDIGPSPSSSVIRVSYDTSYYSSEIADAKREINLTLHSIGNLESQISTEKREIESLQREANALAEKVGRAQKQLSDLTAKQDKENEDIKDLAQKESDLDTEKSRAQQLTEQSHNEIQELKNNIFQLGNQITENITLAISSIASFIGGKLSWTKGDDSVNGNISGSARSHNEALAEVNFIAKIQEGFDLTNINIGAIIHKTDFDFEKYLERKPGPITQQEGQAIVDFAKKEFVGDKSLRYSDNPKERGGPDAYDCSGFVHAVYTQKGMPYGTKEKPIPNVQDIVDDKEHWKEITREEAIPGDLIVHLKKDTGRASNHVGILSDIDPEGTVMEISAQTRRGQAKFKIDHPDHKPPIHESQSIIFGEQFRVYRRVKI
ncbi:MAG: C40 family peptidase [Oligoflexia bacterium]|nr:C40 family peptidase [Oligoflexia bacterium]